MNGSCRNPSPPDAAGTLTQRRARIALGVVLGYVIGGIPFAYLAGRRYRGVDLRQYGTGTLSGTSVYFHVSRKIALAVWVLDAAKGAAATWLALRLGTGLGGAVAAGTASVAGHNWSPFVGFRGGRGISCWVGMMALLCRRNGWLMLATFPVGRVTKATAEINLLAMLGLSLPIVPQPLGIRRACQAMAVLTAVKRLEANGLPLPASRSEWPGVLWRRLWADRDTAERDEWVMREPEGGRGASTVAHTLGSEG